MFRRFMGSKGDDDGVKATKVNLPGESKMYYCPEKKRWRTKGEEHLEKEDEVAAPPPLPMAKPKEGEAGAPPAEPKPAAKAATGLDAMMAVPSNPYASRLAQPKPAPMVPPMAPMGAFGQPPAPAQGEDAQAADASGGAPAAGPFGGGGAPAHNPFAPKAPAAANPNAPRAFGAAGGPAVNPNAPRGPRERPARKAPAKPKPPGGNPFAAAMGGFHGAPVPKFAPPVPASPADDEGEGAGASDGVVPPAMPELSSAGQGDADAGVSAGDTADGHGGHTGQAPVVPPAVQPPVFGGGMAVGAPGMASVTAPFGAAPVGAASEQPGADGAQVGGAVPGAYESAPAPSPAMPIQTPAMPVQPPQMSFQPPAMPVQQPAMPFQAAAMPFQSPGPTAPGSAFPGSMAPGAMAVQRPVVEVPAAAPAAEPMMVQPPAFPAALPTVAAPAVSTQSVQPPMFHQPVQSMPVGGPWQPNVEQAEDEEIPDMPADEATLQQMPARLRRRVLQKELSRRLAEMSEAPGKSAEVQEMERHPVEVGGAPSPVDLQERQKDLDQNLRNKERELEQQLADKELELAQKLQEKEQQFEQSKAKQDGRLTELEQRLAEREEDLAKEKDLNRRLAEQSGDERKPRTPREEERLKEALKEAEGRATSHQTEADVLKEHTKALEMELEDERSKGRNLDAARQRAETDLEVEKDRVKSQAEAQSEQTAQHAQSSDEVALEEAQRRKSAEAALERERRESADRLKALAEKLEEADLKRREVEERASTLEKRVQELAEEEPQVVSVPLLGSAPPPARTASSAWEEEHALPDFVWSCGNNEVMSFVQKLIAENEALKKAPPVVVQEQAARAAGPQTSASMTVTKQACPKTPFETQNVSADDVIAFASTVGEADSHQIISLLELFEQHKDDVSVCSQLCVALENLTFENDDHRAVIARAGGVEAVLRMLKQHQSCEGSLLQHTVDALWNITFDDEAVDRATNADGITTLAQVMNVHGGAAGLQAAACAVFLNLAVREENRWRIVQAGVVGLIAKAMEQHPDDEDVLEQGCQALYMLGYHPDIRPLVSAAKGGMAAGIAAKYEHGTGRAQKWGKWLVELLDP